MTEQPPGPPPGYPPPPPGSYPPPPPGSYPPPPGSYPPPPGGYPPPYGGYTSHGYGPPGGYPPPGAFDIGAGFSWAWHMFRKHAAPLILVPLLLGLALVACQFVLQLVVRALSPDTHTTYVETENGLQGSYITELSLAGGVVLVLGLVAIFVAAAAVQSAYLNGLLGIADGRDVAFGSFLRPRRVGAVLATTVLVGIAYLIGFVLCIVPGLVVAVFAQFTVFALLDRDLTPVDAIKASIDVVKNNLGSSIVVWLLAGLVSAAGILLCGVGVLVTAPLAQLFVVYAYRTLGRGQVAPATP
ncbi:hypothetical protein LV457_01015 [Mycobacterium sp. MYCO198283]|uniref:hypothetical protein n=1 Tax=Mycobacterium sp. MYCO198283 TaxID=2883505 RepID=UPI001E565687|nr:hypothetical protein [Mycobacterium sp. MYCO198283]MCG5430881.1 hypothetical protein [Mycobacterium sp. MYCO198283]